VEIKEFKKNLDGLEKRKNLANKKIGELEVELEERVRAEGAVRDMKQRLVVAKATVQQLKEKVEELEENKIEVEDKTAKSEESVSKFKIKIKELETKKGEDSQALAEQAKKFKNIER